MSFYTFFLLLFCCSFTFAQTIISIPKNPEGITREIPKKKDEVKKNNKSVRRERRERRELRRMKLGFDEEKAEKIIINNQDPNVNDGTQPKDVDSDKDKGVQSNQTGSSDQ